MMFLTLGLDCHHLPSAAEGFASFKDCNVKMFLSLLILSCYFRGVDCSFQAIVCSGWVNQETSEKWLALNSSVYVHICVCMHMCEGILCIILLVFLIIIIRVARIAGVKTVYSGTQNKGEEWWRLQKVFVSASCWYLQSFIYYKYEDL